MLLWIIVLGGGKRRESDASIGAADGGVVGFALLGQNKTYCFKIKHSNKLDKVKLNQSNWHYDEH